MEPLSYVSKSANCNVISMSNGKNLFRRQIALNQRQIAKALIDNDDDQLFPASTVHFAG
jgi:hypothetical protein